MDYFKLMDEIFDLCIVQNDESEIWYLTPHWKIQIETNYATDGNLFMYHISMLDLSIDDIKDILSLEVSRRNAFVDKSIVVLNWLYEIITSNIDPAITQEESEYFKNVIEYMKIKENENKKEETKNSNKKTNDKKEKLSKLIPEGMSFKKEIG